MFDLLIRGATILDGTGAEGYRGDVAISGGKIAAIGTNLGPSRETICAEGLCLSPGWMDAHSHADYELFRNPDLTEKVEQGITFCVDGHCGGSVAPNIREDGTVRTFAACAAQLKDERFGCSSGILVGHGNLRNAVIGRVNRDPEREELAAMQKALEETLDAGAIGLSLGLYYAPGCYAPKAELESLMRQVGQRGGVVSAHLRNEGDTLVESTEEFVDLIAKSGCRGVISHHKAMEPHNWGKVQKTLELIDAANSSGCDIYMDVYPYTASGTSIRSRFLPGNMHPPGTKSAMSLLEDPEMCRMFKQWGIDRWGKNLDWSLVSFCPGYPQYEGKTIQEIAQMLGREDQYEVAFDLIRWTGGRASCSFFLACEEDLETVLRHPRTMLCTDSGVAGIRNHYHPRLRGAFPRALGLYARERGLLSIPEMIRRMTSLPAAVYGIENKGLVKIGFDADLCIFDPETIADTATYQNCASRNTGLRYVLVDGIVVVENGRYNGKRMGKLYVR